MVHDTTHRPPPPGADVAAYYRRCAENHVGLIITEGTVIDHPASAKIRSTIAPSCSSRGSK